MTVKELIEKLETLPPEAVVIYKICSEYEELQSDDILLALPSHVKKLQIVKHQGRYMSFNEAHWKGISEQAELVSACCLPGN